MPDETAPPLTVKELLPALIELASIQHDLLTLGAPDQKSHGSVLDKLYPSTQPSRSYSIVDDRQALVRRSRALLTWLISKTQAI
jgi:hypothetical protein